MAVDLDKVKEHVETGLKVVPCTNAYHRQTLWYLDALIVEVERLRAALAATGGDEDSRDPMWRGGPGMPGYYA